MPRPWLNSLDREHGVTSSGSGCGPQLYSPMTNTKASAARIFPARASIAGGAEPLGYSLYIRSRIGRTVARVDQLRDQAAQAMLGKIMELGLSRIPTRSAR